MTREPQVFLVNPAHTTVGMSFLTPRWLFVIAAATPSEFGDPILIDESIKRFNPKKIHEGDIVGIGITTDNCLRGYEVLREAKQRGATVIMGGIHTTIFPDEPLAKGADAVITGSGDVVWGKAVKDASGRRLLRRYDGGRESGDKLLPARWDLLISQNLRHRYLWPTVQTVVGCPEHCTFCSVWVTEGREPRLRTTDAIVQEVNQLIAMGFGTLMFADDNFNPGTKGRIARETSPSIRRKLEIVRERRMTFFEEYARRVDRILPSFTQMTSEVVTDPEYLDAMHRLMGVHGALIGIESFTEEGLKATRKGWNPVGERMVETVRTIQAHGIRVLGSMINGIETDTTATICRTGEFAKASGMFFAQFPILRPYPGTVDMSDLEKDVLIREAQHKGDKLQLAPKHAIKLLFKEPWWSLARVPRVVIEHPHMTAEELLRANQECWNSFYAFPAVWRRARELPASWKWKLVLILTSLGFRRLYAGRGISADGARGKLGLGPRLTLIGAARVMALASSRRKGSAPQEAELAKAS